MFKITNIESIGNDYSVTDQSGTLIKKIQVMTHTDILEAALGKFSESFDSVTNYLTKSREVLSGFDAIDPNKVLWYSTTDEEIVLSDVIEYAIQHDYDKIILEHLDEIE